jgi:hypothetical protein
MMQDYSKLVKALRHCSGDRNCQECEYDTMLNCADPLKADAADAIEALQAEVDEATQYNTYLLNMKEMTKEEEEEILEYIRTTPVGPIEPMLIEQLPKQGKWIEDTTTYAGHGLSNYKCSLCGKICGTWRSGLEPSELPNWCGNCGADMRKKEVQINGFNKK